MANINLLPPSPLGSPPGSGFWNDWYEKLRVLINSIASGFSWTLITGTPTTLGGYGITDAQPLDSDLTALASTAATGLYTITGVGTSATRTIIGTATQITVTNGNGVAGNPTLSFAIPITSGIYTPTLTNTTNITASTAYQAHWLRINDMVHVAGKFDVNTTVGATASRMGLSLPIASNLANQEDLAGSASASNVQGESAAIRADAVNDRADVVWITPGTGNHGMFFSFMYQVI